jgi:HK97 family phage major capsid protein
MDMSMQNTDGMERMEVRTGIQYRAAEITVKAENPGNEEQAQDGQDGSPSFECYFSSEAPVQDRMMWDATNGDIVFGTEILLHGNDNVDLSWISSGRAPFLKDHDQEEQVGVITGCELDLSSRACKLTGIKFSRSEGGCELKQDIIDGIRKNVSVGYVIQELVEAERGVYHVTKWKPYEVSSVSIPADEGVGFRSAERSFSTVVYRRPLTAQTQTINKERDMDPITETGGNMNPAPVVVETENIASQIAAQAEAARHLCPKSGELAARAIAEGISPKEFYERHLAPAIIAEQERQATVQIGLTAKDKQRFSLVKLVRHLSGDTVDAKYELDVCDAYCSARGISSQRGGAIIPHEAIPMSNRAAIISSGTGAGVVEEIHSGEVIEYLREQAVLARAGARFISGLVGKYDMARVGVGTSAYWVGEKNESGADITTSAMDLDLLQFTLKTVGVNQGITRQMLKQTSMDVEGIVRGDIFASLADAIDLAGLAGTGSSNNQPAGLIGTSGVGTETLAAANSPAWSDVVNMETAVAEAKALRGSLAYIAHPTLIGNMKQTLKASGVSGFVAENGQVNGYGLFSSNNAIASSVKRIIFGNFAELMVGLWGGIEVVADPYTYSRKGIVSVTAFQDVDVQLRHPASFVASTNPT